MKIENNVVIELGEIRFGENIAILIPFEIAKKVYDEAVKIAEYNEQTAEDYQQFEPSDYFFYALNKFFPIKKAIEHTSSEINNKGLRDDFEEPNNLKLSNWDDLKNYNFSQENLWEQFKKQIFQLKEQKTTVNKKILKEIIKQELRKTNLI